MMLVPILGDGQGTASFATVMLGMILAVVIGFTLLLWKFWGRTQSRRLRLFVFIPLLAGVVVIAPPFLLFLSAAVSWLLPRYNPTQAETAGHYHGSLFGIDQDLDLNADGTFSQKVDYHDGRIFDQKGNWQISSDLVTLVTNSYEPYDFERKGMLVRPLVVAYVSYRYYYRDKILLDESSGDLQYMLRRK